MRFIFAGSYAATIPGLQLSPFGVGIPPSKIREMHAFTFSPSTIASAVNANTDFDTAPPCAVGNLLRDVLWRILYLQITFGAYARRVLRNKLM